MSFTFDTQKAFQRLRESGVEEGQAAATVDVLAEATSSLVTQEFFAKTLRAEMAGLRAELYRALAIQGGVILAGVGVIVALVETLN